MVRDKALSAGFGKFAPSSAVLFTTLAMMSSSNAAPSLSYAERAKLGKSPAPSQSPTPSSPSTTDVEKQGEDVFHSGALNGLSSPHGTTPNFWAVRKEQMAAKAAPAAGSSSSSPTLVPSPSLPASATLRGTRNVNGVNLNDTSNWPEVAAASTPTKDKSDKTSSKDTTTPLTPTPKKSEKTKWVPIPPTELQAAADAVTRGRSSPKHASATTSTNSSPKISSRGRRLQNDDSSHDHRRRSPSHLATHAYTHPFNSPTRPTSTFVVPTHAPHLEPHHPPLTRQKRPTTPARSGPVAGYRDIDDLKMGEGRLVMFGSIGAPSSSTDLSPKHRGLGLDIGIDPDRKRREETWEVGRRVGGGIAIGIHPDELARSKIAQGSRGRNSAPSTLTLSSEIVDLTEGAWLRDVILVNSDNGERGARERKWEFGTSRHPPNNIPISTLSSQPPQTPQTYPLPHMGYAQPLAPPTSISAPESVVGDPVEYDVRPVLYGEPYAAGLERERRGGYGGHGRRGRYGGGRGGPNGSLGRGYGARRGNPPPQHYAPPLPGPYVPHTSYHPPPPPPPPPPPGPDGYYMGPPYTLPYPQYVPPPVPPYAAPPVLDPTIRPTPVPIPVTVTSFPIDPTRWYLLGQVEYYFSVQNLCADFWLRKQMDSHGWVPISVIASFNRVRQLTYDFGLVRDVMGLSALVEVQGDKVRLRDRQWAPFILPDAAPSDLPEPMEQLQQHQQQYAIQSVNETAYSRPEEAEEEEVVFVMDKEGEDPNTEIDLWPLSDAVEQSSHS